MERKILPVGEVGKTLSDVTAIANLSAQLREKFGGLKKFLERYPEIFVISKDHPFNPNVVLRKSLTSEQFDMFEKKGVPLQTFFKQAAPAQKQPVIPQVIDLLLTSAVNFLIFLFLRVVLIFPLLFYHLKHNRNFNNLYHNRKKLLAKQNLFQLSLLTLLSRFQRSIM